MVKYGDSGLDQEYIRTTYVLMHSCLDLAYRRQHGRHRPKRQPIDAVSVFFFLSPSPFSASSSLSQHEKEIKNKLSTDSPCFGPLSVGWSKEIIRELTCEDRPYFRRWSWKLRRGEGRWKDFSCVVIIVMKWSSTKNHRSLLDLFGVGAGEEQEKHSRYPKR